MARLPEAETAAPRVPENPTLDKLRGAAAGCEACALHLTGTQTVFGEGPKRAKVMMVGEQPGDYEDRVGQPFVGPAGKLLDRALEDAGIDRSKVYVTNVVKHFKWTAKGKKRIHSTPNMREIRACRPWLDSEINLVEPDVLVALGATAAKALLGSDFRVTTHRGEFVESDLAPLVMATVHPSSILRAEDEERDQQMAAFVADLAKVADAERQLH
ncbi:MAG TPA: UdgX family uracil-DNA binding protein [Dehalococcoidia bacterium]|nr:UdgX family uracil-DNA binding protein [Dehalococcoidia bacterium]